MVAGIRPRALATDCDVHQVACPSHGNEAVVDVVGLASSCAMEVSWPPLATGRLSCLQMVGTHEAKVIQQSNPLEVRLAEARIAVEIAEDDGRCGLNEGGVRRQAANQ